MGPVLKFLFSLFLGTGFSFFAQTGTINVDSIKVGSGYRGYRLYVPATYTPSKKIPLVINLHGLGSNAWQQELYGNFMPVADTGYFMVLHPEGTESGSGKYWNAGLLPVPDDVQFISRLIDSVSLLYNVDADRVYSCGLSNGAILSYYLACSVPGKIAAIASVAGTMFRTWFYTCKPALAMPVLVIHGTEDGTVPYEGAPGNGLYMPVDTIVEKWREHNHCQKTPVIAQLPDTDLSDFSNVTHMIYPNGADDSQVELYKVNGGSHSWPGAMPAFFHQNMDFNASAEIWRFFSRFRLSQFQTQVGIVSEATITEKHLQFFPNPVENILHVTAPGVERYVIISCEGKRVIETTSGTIMLDDLSSGMYILEAWKGSDCQRTRFIRQ